MTTDPTSLRADARRNYDQLIRAAEAILAAQGALPNLENIAKRAGVGIGTLYRHFPTRQSLLEAIYADKISELVTKAHSLLQGSAPDKALITWLQTTVKYMATYGDFDDLMKIALKDKDSTIILAGSELLAKAQKTGLLRADVTILDLLRLVSGIAASDTSATELKRADDLVSAVVTAFKKPA